jgi:hypothetical protein
MLFYYILPSTQFINGINIAYVFPTTSFRPIGPYSGMFSVFIWSPLFPYSPHTAQCSHIGSAVCVFFLFALLLSVVLESVLKYYIIIGDV